MRKAQALFCCLLILTSLSFSVGCDEAKKIRGSAERFVVYAEVVIEGVDQFKSDGFFAGFESQVDEFREGMVQARAITQDILDKAKTYEKFDATNKADLAKAFSDVTAILNRHKALAESLVRRVVETLNARGVTAVKDIDALVGRFRLGLSVVSASSKVIESRLAP